MKKRISLTFILLSLISVLLLTGCAGKEERAWNAGQKALAKENYADAVEAFEKAGRYEDADRLLLYAGASLDLENGNYAQAEKAFRNLGDFKDSALMCTYCLAREQEANMQAGFSSGDTDAAVGAAMDALGHYRELPLFRDCNTRAEACGELLYTRASEWMQAGSFADAASAFEALGNWQDSAALQKYCLASSLEQQSRYVEAADLFAEIPDVQDASARADAARQRAYQLALDLKDTGDYEAAIEAFDALGSYRDAADQRDSATASLVRVRIQAGSYADALEKLSQLKDLSVFPAVDAEEAESRKLFLDSFCNVWLNAHAGVMNAFFSCNLLQPYLIPGGELDTLVRAEIADPPMLNYGYVYKGAELEKLLQLDEGYIAAWMHATASWGNAEGPVDADETLLILLDTTLGNPLAAAVLPLSSQAAG